jgi:hypothetical protein
VRFIEYNFVQGSHVASNMSDFQDIAKFIKAIHEQNTVHADIRGFNMLHPLPGDGGIANSRPIDFDLCGRPGADVNPPGFSDSIRDTKLVRRGKPGKTIELYHDWQELASNMVLYTIANEALEEN